MFQTLFHIPHAIGPLPIFGLGWAVIVWGVICAIWIGLMLSRGEGLKEIQSSAALMLIVAMALVVIMPRIEERIEAREGITELGVPIRGYGTMLLVAIVAGVGLAAYRGWRMGLDPEVILSLAFWMMVSGIVGARLFFVIQKWDQFQRDTVQETFYALMDFVNGGLVVFGSAIGALLALVIFCRIRKLPTLAIADLVAPSMMVGLAFGRVGCLLNGCCYGGLCEVPQLALQFPPEAPAYQDQLASGMLFGFRWEVAEQLPNGHDKVTIAWVAPGSPAEQSGLKVGDEIIGLMGTRFDTLHEAQRMIMEMPRIVAQNQETGKHKNFLLIKSGNAIAEWPLQSIPARSLPIHATQIYSSLDAALLALVLWFFYPFRRHDGEVIALMLTLHPISRFLLEVIRIDEAGALGTPFTISQLVGFAFLAAAIVMWLVIERQPRGSALPLRTTTA